MEGTRSDSGLSGSEDMLTALALGSDSWIWELLHGFCWTGRIIGEIQRLELLFQQDRS